jgi:hypothetical protein
MPKAVTEMLRRRALAVHGDIAALLDNTSELDEAGIHILRMASKEVRGLWELLKPILDDFPVAQAIADLAETAATLSETRDRQIADKVLRHLCRRAHGKADRRALKAALRRLQQAESNTGMRAVVSHRLRERWCEDYLRWQTLSLDIDTDELVYAGYGRLYRKASVIAHKAAARDDPRLWHQARKWVKYLALTLPLASDGAWLHDYLTGFHQLEKRIGQLHDLEGLLVRLMKLDWPDHAIDQQNQVHTLIQRKIRSALSDCAAMAEAILTKKPRGFTRKLRAAICP